jgi:L-2-hydroxycarboxylate dehydrogenase (NAD+)
MGLEHDLIGLYMAVGGANHMPPWGGVDPLLSTNPIAVAIPAGNEPPVVLDMATTVASYGRIKVAAERGETLPEGWMVDRSGAPLIDPRRSGEGFLLPIGGYKGYGLSLVIGLLAGVLNGAAFGRQVVDFSSDHRTATNTGQTIVMVRADLFRPLTEFAAEMDEHIRDIRGSTPIATGSPVRTPGDRAASRARDIEEHGLAISDNTVTQLTELAVDLDINSSPFPSGADVSPSPTP